MAEGDGTIYNNFREQILNGEFDLANGADVIKVALMVAHTPSAESHTSYDDSAIQGDEMSGTGYVAGGETLANQATSQATVTGKFDADNVTWSSLDAGTPSHVLMYDDTHASNLLIAYWELGRASNGGDYTLSWNAAGILTVT